MVVTLLWVANAALNATWHFSNGQTYVDKLCCPLDRRHVTAGWSVGYSTAEPTVVLNETNNVYQYKLDGLGRIFFFCVEIVTVM